MLRIVKTFYSNYWTNFHSFLHSIKDNIYGFCFLSTFSFFHLIWCSNYRSFSSYLLFFLFFIFQKSAKPAVQCPFSHGFLAPYHCFMFIWIRGSLFPFPQSVFLLNFCPGMLVLTFPQPKSWKYKSSRFYIEFYIS